MISPHPLENMQDKEGKEGLSANWDDWLIKLKDRINFGESPTETLFITAVAGITKLAGLIRIESATAGTVDITANPQIVAGHDGQFITIEGQSDPKSVKLDNGYGLQLAGGASFTIGLGDVIHFHFNLNRGLWIEDGRSNN